MKNPPAEVKTIRFHPEDYDEAIDKILEYLDEEKPDLVVMGYPLLENDDVQAFL